MFEMIQWCFQDFNHFLGTSIILGMLLTFILKLAYILKGGNPEDIDE